MRKLMVIILVLFMASMSQATDWGVCCAYWCRSDPRPIPQKFVLSVEEGKPTLVSWTSTVSQPTKAQLLSIEADAMLWQADETKDRLSDLDEVTPEVLKAVVKAFTKVINLRLPPDKQISDAEVRQAIKEEL